MGDSANPVRVTQLGYVGIGVSDMAAWRAFAADLGMQVSEASPRGSLYLRIDEYHHRFELYPSGEDDLLYAGWEAKDAAAMQAIANQVRAQGMEVVEGSAEEAAERMVLGLVKFRDPSGVAMEVYYGPQLDGAPLRLPRALSGFKAGSAGFGHIVIGVDDPDVSLRFYMEALGARISDHILFDTGAGTVAATFMHVNQRHHSLALGRKPPGSGRRLAHFMLEVNSIDDVGYARGLLTERGRTCGQFGRHSNDRMFSFYVPSPSGFDVEYGSDGRTIENEDEWEVQHYKVASLWGHGRLLPKTGQFQRTTPAAPTE